MVQVAFSSFINELEKFSGAEEAFQQLDRAGQLEGSGTQLNPPQPHMPTTKPSKKMYKDDAPKTAAASASKAFSFLDRGGALSAIGPSAKAKIPGKPPGLGTFGVKDVAVKPKVAGDACVGVTNADLKTSTEEYRAPIARRTKTSEKMDEEAWKQTLKDLPLVILATGLGWGVGKTISSSLGQQLAQGGVRPTWTKHIPAATAILSSLGSYAMGRSRGELARRREEARQAGGTASPAEKVSAKLDRELSIYVGTKLSGRRA